MLDACNLNKLQRLQNKAVGTLYPKLNTESAFKKSGILHVKSLIKLEEYKLGYKICHNLLPKPLRDCLVTDQYDRTTLKTHSYNTRHKNTPNLPEVKTLKYRNSLLFTTIQSFMHLPLDCKESRSLSVFVKRCKTMLLATKK